jgi:hypothetical protein
MSSQIRVSKSCLKIFCHTILGIGFLFLTAACTSGSDSPGDNPSATQFIPHHDSPIELSEVSSDECLNLQTYYKTLLSLSPNTPTRKITTEFQTTPIENHTGISRNFLLRSAAGNFEVEDTPISEVSEFVPLEQTKCETVVFKGEGHEDSYTIKKFTKDSLTLENDWNGQLLVQWISPTSLKIVHSYFIGNYLCDERSMVQAHSSSMISWGGEDVSSSTLPENAINPEFLSLVTEATGFSLESLYTTIHIPVEIPPAPEQPTVPPEVPGDFPGGSPVAAERKLLVEKLKEMRMQPVRAELLTCF